MSGTNTPPIIALRVFSPAQIVAVSTIIYVAVLLTAPISIANVGSVKSAGVLAAFYACLLVGMVGGNMRIRSKVIRIMVNPERLLRLKWMLAITGGLGLGLKIFERVYLRAGGVITADFVTNRDLVMQSGSTPIAMVAAFLAPFLFFIPVVVFMLWGINERRKVDYLLLVLSASYALFDLVFLGSRSGLLIFISMLMMSRVIVGGRSIRLKHIVYMVSGGLVFMWISGMIFWMRLSQMGIDPVRALYSSVSAYMVTMNGWVLAIIQDKGNAGLNGLLYAYSTTCQYLLLGSAEFLNLVDTFSRNHTYGLQLLYVPAKVIWVLTGQAGSIEDFIASNQERVGVYTTLFGPIFYDFGIWGGVLACLCLGWSSGWLARKLRRGAIHLVMPYTLVMAVLPFTLVISLITSGTGQYLLIDAIFVAALLKRKRWRLAA